MTALVQYVDKVKFYFQVIYDGDVKNVKQALALLKLFKQNIF